MILYYIIVDYSVQSGSPEDGATKTFTQTTSFHLLRYLWCVFHTWGNETWSIKATHPAQWLWRPALESERKAVPTELVVATVLAPPSSPVTLAVRLSFLLLLLNRPFLSFYFTIFHLSNSIIKIQLFVVTDTPNFPAVQGCARPLPWPLNFRSHPSSSKRNEHVLQILYIFSNTMDLVMVSPFLSC